MARNTDLDQAVGLLNTATNTLGSGVGAIATALDALSIRVFALVNKLSTRMTDAEVAEVKTALDQETNRVDNAVVALGGIAASLTGLAADPADPIPEPVPEPVPELPATPVV